MKENVTLAVRGGLVLLVLAGLFASCRVGKSTATCWSTHLGMAPIEACYPVAPLVEELSEDPLVVYAGNVRLYRPLARIAVVGRTSEEKLEALARKRDYLWTETLDGKAEVAWPLENIGLTSLYSSLKFESGDPFVTGTAPNDAYQVGIRYNRSTGYVLIVATGYESSAEENIRQVVNLPLRD